MQQVFVEQIIIKVAKFAHVTTMRKTESYKYEDKHGSLL